MRAIPTINTSRLTLRAMRPEDFGHYAALWKSPQVVTYVGGTPWSTPEAWTSFLRNIGHWQVMGYGLWAVEPRGERVLMGQVGFFLGMRELGEDFDACPEASWVLHPDIQGQGYGLEAAEAAHEWFDRVVTGPLVCKFQPENARSKVVAEALGYTPLRLAEWQGSASQLMVRENPPGGGTRGRM